MVLFVQSSSDGSGPSRSQDMLQGHSQYMTLFLWAVWTISVAFVFRTFVGPAILRLVSKRLRIRSISLRSIRGIYFRSSLGTLRIARIGISYNGPSVQSASRFSIRVEGLSLEVGHDILPESRAPSTPLNGPTSPLRTFVTRSLPRYMWQGGSTAFSAFYWLLDPYLRPAIRRTFVTLLRVVIRALPALTHVVDLELESAVATITNIAGAEIKLEHARLQTHISLSSPETVANPHVSSQQKDTPRHRRFGSVVDWNARLTGSLRRTWDRAWGSTVIFASVSFQVRTISGSATSDAMAGFCPGRQIGSTRFLDVPSTKFSLSSCINPHRGVEPGSVNTSLSMASVSLDLHVVQSLLACMKSVHRPRSQGESPHVELLRASSPSGANPIPRSPILNALSPSPRLRWSNRQPPVRKLTAQKSARPTCLLKSASFDLPSLTLTYCLPAIAGDMAHTFRATLQDVVLGAGLSHPNTNALHRHILGSRSVPDDELSADVYSLRVSLSSLSIVRAGHGAVDDHLRVLSLGPSHLDGIASQWPLSRLNSVNFLSGDPNAQLLAITISLGAVDLTEHLEMLQRYSEMRGPIDRPPPGASTKQLPTVLSPMPKITFGLEVDTIRIRTIASAVDADVPFALDFTVGGFSSSVTSHYSAISDKRMTHRMEGLCALRMNIDFVGTLKRTFIHVCKGSGGKVEHRQLGSADDTGEPLFAVDTIYLEGHSSALGEIGDDPQSFVTISLPSAYTEVQCSTETISVELWQPDVVESLATFLRHIKENKQDRPSSRDTCASQPLDRLPYGLSATFAVERFVICATSPDIAPDDGLNISRGISVQTSISLSYCAVRHRHAEQLRNLHSYNDKRLRLSLPTEQVVRAIAGTAAPGKNSSIHAGFHISIWNTSVQEAISTPFAVNDPCLDEDIGSRTERCFLQSKKVSIEVALSGRRTEDVASEGAKDDCAITVHISEIRGTLRLAQMYHILLAARRLESFNQPTHTSRQRVFASSPFSLTAHCTLDELQLLLEFPVKSKLFIRLSSFHCGAANPGKLDFNSDSILCAVSLPTNLESSQVEEWEELLRLLQWRGSIHHDIQPPSIAVEGDSGRLHIPFDFSLADLILDINATVKSIKHMRRMIRNGQYQQPPVPEAESAKSVPKISIIAKSLVFEAADEDLEAQLGLIFRAGFDAARLRQSRSEAFEAKVASLGVATSHENSHPANRFASDYQFSPESSISVEEARQRLYQVHSVSWRSAFTKAKAEQKRREEAFARKSLAKTANRSSSSNSMVYVKHPRNSPPLCRLRFEHLVLSIAAPSFTPANLKDFLHELGQGLPRDTEFSLLIPMHIDLTVKSLRFSFREYPLPLLHVPPSKDNAVPGLHFDSDIVIAEEMGTDSSVDWVNCDVVKLHHGIHGASPFSIPVPKTIMPVKTYARPTIQVLTDDVTDFAWGVSYAPAMQDLLRVLDTLSHAPRDPSPPIGIWDKLRLIFHWRISVSFKSEVHFHVKGSRDPHELEGKGAGFALCWHGSPKLLIGQPNNQGELIQVISDTMLVVIPNIKDRYGYSSASSRADPARMYRKVCAKVASGICFGVGFALERACGPECDTCTGPPFRRVCRLFDFKPHYEVKLENKSSSPETKSTADSYNGFRSDFIHMSLSLTSALRSGDVKKSSSIHLSPDSFAHFWAWWALFDSTLSLPIRQGSRHNGKRPISPKFGKHLATLKYRVSIPQLFLTHLYVDNSPDTWIDGVRPYVGVKALVNHFQVDMHQRDQERSLLTPGGLKSIHHKTFYAIEVVMRNLDLRTVLAVFPEPLRRAVSMTDSNTTGSYRSELKNSPVKTNSQWFDWDDFEDMDGTLHKNPTLYLLPTVSCPRFTYFKKAPDVLQSSADGSTEFSKFGSEATHQCALGKEESVVHVQIQLALERIQELKRKGHPGGGLSISTDDTANVTDLPTDSGRMVALLDNYISQLRKLEAESHRMSRVMGQNYYMPLDSVSAEEWSAFDHVYQVHCPQVFMDSDARNILMQYYHCSRSRRGLEYHMANRAVKFIRDQAQTALADVFKDESGQGGHMSGPHAAALAVKRLLMGDIEEDDDAPATDVQFRPPGEKVNLASVDPLDGWSEGVSLQRSHFCLLLKPQIVLRDASTDSVCILAAVQGKLKSFDIMDVANAEDPISGKVMSRNLASITGLQTFSPSAVNTSGEGCVPLEVLIDLRCENSAFDRLVPQTDASLQYDKFNRLRLRNRVTSAAPSSGQPVRNHLQNQTDLVRIHVPQFTVSANDRHFQAISGIITNLVLYSDPAVKIRSEKLEKMLFSYDFTNLSSAADVVESMQSRLRHAIETRKGARWTLRRAGEQGQVELLKINAHVLLLGDELNLIFDAIKSAQDRLHDKHEQKSALLLHASSSDVSWRMLDHRSQLLAKLSVRDIDFYWLNKDDSTLVNHLAIGDLQAWDGAADAEWTEILSKYDDASWRAHHKRQQFLVANWTVLPPVGGITIYESFELAFHPLRLQIDTRMGRRIMEYLWPTRRKRKSADESRPSLESAHPASGPSGIVVTAPSPQRMSSDMVPARSTDRSRLSPASHPLRKLSPSRSFTDLRNTATGRLQAPVLHRTRSNDALRTPVTPLGHQEARDKAIARTREIDYAAEMKTRSSQKTFIFVKVSSLHLMLSVRKEDSFVLRDAKIVTRDLEYRDQILSFEELFDQVIPSDMNWKGLIKMAFQQPLVPVFPVARELLSKTKFKPSRSHHGHDGDSPSRMTTPKMLSLMSSRRGSDMTQSSGSGSSPSAPLETGVLTTEPESLLEEPSSDTTKRRKFMDLLKRKPHEPRSSFESDVSATSSFSWRRSREERRSSREDS